MALLPGLREAARVPGRELAAAIRRALAATDGNMSRAAVRLNIGRATLYRKSKKYGIVRP